MDFDFTEEQGLLRDSVAKLLDNHYADFEKRRGYAKRDGGFDRTIWAEYAESGLLALPFSEDQGGFGGGPVETMIVMEEIPSGIPATISPTSPRPRGARATPSSSKATRPSSSPAIPPPI
jgi:alkylation response protein AidB-like acyl-CoA dehydrogenase